jgi:hypothetical protein
VEQREEHPFEGNWEKPSTPGERRIEFAFPLAVYGIEVAHPFHGVEGTRPRAAWMRASGSRASKRSSSNLPFPREREPVAAPPAGGSPGRRVTIPTGFEPVVTP